jgi:hypothetical protein
MTGLEAAKRTAQGELADGWMADSDLPPYDTISVVLNALADLSGAPNATLQSK